MNTVRLPLTPIHFGIPSAHFTGSYHGNDGHYGDKRLGSRGNMQHLRMFFKPKNSITWPRTAVAPHQSQGTTTRQQTLVQRKPTNTTYHALQADASTTVRQRAVAERVNV